MPLPGVIETQKHYTTVRSFRKDERKMVAAGWSTERLQLFKGGEGPLRRLLRRRAPAEVDARYLRSNWPGAS